MDSEEKAREVLRCLRKNSPKPFVERIGDMGRGGWALLLLLDEHPEGVLPGEISRKLDLSTPRVAALLKRLEADDCVSRTRSPEDARCTSVQITETGKKRLWEWKENTVKFFAAVIDDVGEEDFDRLLAILAKVKQAVIRLSEQN